MRLKLGNSVEWPDVHVPQPRVGVPDRTILLRQEVLPQRNGPWGVQQHFEKVLKPGLSGPFWCNYRTDSFSCLILYSTWCRMFTSRNQGWESTSTPRVEGSVTEKNSGKWVFAADAKRSTSARPNIFQIIFTFWEWSLHSPWVTLCLDTMSAP